MTLTEAQIGFLIKDLYTNIDYTFQGWDPSFKVWRAGDAGPRELPYATADFVDVGDKKFGSFGDIVGRLDDFRFEHAFCETMLVVVSVYANKYHNSNTVRGRDFCSATTLKMRNWILAYWNDILYNFNASIDRGKPTPIKDVSNYKSDVGTRVHEYELSVFLKTDVRWYKGNLTDPAVEERAEKAYITMNDENNIRIDSS